MLSPCVGQVAHALLTRPPLSYASLGFSITPFDLHVLGTPPAFILSQDQTLMFVSPASSSGFFVSAEGLPPAGASPVSRFRASSECLPFWNFQVCITVYLSKCICRFLRGSLIIIPRFLRFVNCFFDFFLPAPPASAPGASMPASAALSPFWRWNFMISHCFASCQQ